MVPVMKQDVYGILRINHVYKFPPLHARVIQHKAIVYVIGIRVINVNHFLNVKTMIKIIVQLVQDVD